MFEFDRTNKSFDEIILHKNDKIERLNMLFGDWSMGKKCSLVNDLWKTKLCDWSVGKMLPLLLPQYLFRIFSP